MLRDTYVEINLDHLAYNIKNIRAYVGSVAIAAVVKADAYGHGAVEVVRTALENGVDVIAVATLTEALELREHFDAEIFIMGYTPNENLSYVVQHQLTQCIFSYEQAVILNDLGRKEGVYPKVHIKYDTGFNRLGFKDSKESVDEIKRLCQLPYLHVEGIFSHFALAGDDENKAQYKRFIEAVHSIQHDFKYRHICDSISAIDYPEFHLEMVRVGAILYGLKSFRKHDLPLKQVLQFKTKVYHIKKIKAGEGVSYNYKWQAKRDSVIATLPVGYSDGYPRNMFEKGMVTIGGVQAPVVGVICMDQCMVDVTDMDVKVGDEVIIYGDGNNQSLSIEMASKIGGTNKNELISRIARRTPRVYIKDGKILKVLDYLLEGARYGHKEKN